MKKRDTHCTENRKKKRKEKREREEEREGRRELEEILQNIKQEGNTDPDTPLPIPSPLEERFPDLSILHNRQRRRSEENHLSYRATIHPARLETDSFMKSLKTFTSLMPPTLQTPPHLGSLPESYSPHGATSNYSTNCEVTHRRTNVYY